MRIQRVDAKTHLSCFVSYRRVECRMITEPCSVKMELNAFTKRMKNAQADLGRNHWSVFCFPKDYSTAGLSQL